MTLIHINRARGHYIGQIRRYGHRKWDTVTGKCKTPEAAIAKAVMAQSEWHRVRVLFIDSSGWYEPNLAFEGKNA